jgi:hypothetical protein
LLILVSVSKSALAWPWVPPLPAETETATNSDTETATQTEAVSAPAQPASVEATKPVSASPKAKPPRFIASLVLAFPSYTYLGSTAMAPSTSITIADRFSTIEAIGLGYTASKRLRLYLFGIFSETFTGLPATASKLQIGAVAPLGQLTFGGGFTVALGPIYAYRFAGANQSNYGGVFQLGRPFRLGGGFAVSPAFIAVGFLKDRFVLVNSVGVTLGKAF